MLLLELLPSVANGFLKRKRTEEYQAEQPAKEETKVEAQEEAPITGPTLCAPMGGRIIEVRVKPGDKVSKGTVLLVYEAMKMENDVEADKDATVKRIFVKPDEVVGTNAVLIEFE
jgi:pyruvate carboxylase subunit B